MALIGRNAQSLCHLLSLHMSAELCLGPSGPWVSWTGGLCWIETILCGHLSITLAPVAGAMASSCRIVQSPHPHSNHRITLPYQRPVEFLSALLCPLPLRDLGIIRCFLCIIPTCTRSSEGVIGPNCVGYLPSSLLLNHSHILVGMVTFNMDFSERKSGRLPQATPLEALNLPNLSEYLKTSP